MTKSTGAAASGSRVVLDGPIRIEHDDGTVSPVPPGLQPLLVLLCLTPPPARNRESILAALWPDTDPTRARGRLSTALWRLRGLLRSPDDEGPPERGDQPLAALPIRCDDADSWLELESLEVQSVEWSDPSVTAAQGRLERIAVLDPDSLAAGCYHDWVVAKRETLRVQSHRLLAALVTVSAEQGRQGRAIELAELLVDRDGLREDGHRALMRLYAETGRRSEALRQYELCRSLLASELGVEPMPETAELAEAIRLRCPAAPAAAVALAVEPSFPALPDGYRLTVGDDLSSIIAALERARAAIREVEEALGLPATT